MLAIDAIKGVPWAPGESQLDPGHWPDIYQKIFTADKLTQVFNSQCRSEHWLTILDILNQQVGCVDNTAYMLEVDASQKEQAVKLLHRYGIDA